MQTKLQELASYILPVFLVAVLLLSEQFYFDPFQNTLVSNTASLSRLTLAQRANIELAAKKLSGTILAANQGFSFNKVVGPRTGQKGYCKSASYLESDTPSTFGGGICLLSSLVYKSAIELGLRINERTAHTRTTQCIAPGFDATVWYGANDLRFTNTLKGPIKIESEIDGQNLTVKLVGKKSTDITLGRLRRVINRSSQDTIDVTVLKEKGEKLALISRDRYRLNGASNNVSANEIDN